MIKYDQIGKNLKLYYRQNKKNINIITIILIFFLVCSFAFIFNNERFYKVPIGKIIGITESKNGESTNISNIKAKDKTQHIKAVIMNGKYKNSVVEFKNISTYSNTINYNLKLNDEVFLKIKDSEGKIKSVSFLEYKRDKYMIYILDIFVVLVCIIGSIKGFKSLVSLSINAVILMIIVELFFKGCNLILISSLGSLIFIITSIFIVHGINKKSYSAIISTIITILLTMFIYFFVIKLSKYNGLYLDEMDFQVYNPKIIVLSAIMIGTLGATMDITISIAATVEEMCRKNKFIKREALIKSTEVLGQDIMGTMTNTLLFAYLSGSIPSIVLIMMNGFSISYIIKIGINVELLRALIGSIGIVLSIPISRYVSIAMFKNMKAEV